MVVVLLAHCQGTMYSKTAKINSLPLEQKQNLGIKKAMLFPWKKYLLHGAKFLVLEQITPFDMEKIPVIL